MSLIPKNLDKLTEAIEGALLELSLGPVTPESKELVTTLKKTKKLAK